MSAGDSNYKVGPGKPPLHTRFQKGQSGNPSGKPGPAKLAKQRFQRALHAALDEPWSDLNVYERGQNLEYMARSLARDALGGSLPALKFILTELDKEIVRDPSACGGAHEAGEGNEAKDESAEEGADEPPPLLDYARWIKANPEQ